MFLPVGNATVVQTLKAITINQSLQALTRFLSLVGKSTGAGPASKKLDPRTVMRDSVLTQLLYPRICNARWSLSCDHVIVLMAPLLSFL
jgi:hypothetical protein